MAIVSIFHVAKRALNQQLPVVVATQSSCRCSALEQDEEADDDDCDDD